MFTGCASLFRSSRVGFIRQRPHVTGSMESMANHVIHSIESTANHVKKNGLHHNSMISKALIIVRH